MTYTLQKDGDSFEKRFYNDIIKTNFPSYEIFWQKFIIPLTNRPKDIQLKTDDELNKIGRNHNDLCIAQLHYTILRQLIRTFQLMKNNNFEVDHLILAMATLVGSQDCAFELLERFINPIKYDPWINKKIKGGPDGSQEAQNEWKKKNSYPLQHIRNYRNNLVHGRTLPGIIINGQLHIPKVGKETNYFDWRLVTAASTLPINDFNIPIDIIKEIYNETISYYDNKWKELLLPKL